MGIRYKEYQNVYITEASGAFTPERDILAFSEYESSL